MRWSPIGPSIMRLSTGRPGIDPPRRLMVVINYLFGPCCVPLFDDAKSGGLPWADRIE